MLNRIKIIQRLIRATGARNYLEIGVNTGTCFLRIKASTKLGVDPAFKISSGRKLKYLLKNPSNRNNRYFDQTSDDFFEINADLLKTCKPQVVFIDGLHTYEQSLKDVINSLRYLGEGGIILMHDCSPASEAAAYPADSFEHMTSLQVPGYAGMWNGDVWKTIVHLRSMHRDLEVGVMNCDHGIGFVRRGNPESTLDFSAADIKGMTYRDLQGNRENLLNLKEPEYLYELAGRVASEAPFSQQEAM